MELRKVMVKLDVYRLVDASLTKEQIQDHIFELIKEEIANGDEWCNIFEDIYEVDEDGNELRGTSES